MSPLRALSHLEGMFPGAAGEEMLKLPPIDLEKRHPCLARDPGHGSGRQEMGVCTESGEGGLRREAALAAVSRLRGLWMPRKGCQRTVPDLRVETQRGPGRGPRMLRDRHMRKEGPFPGQGTAGLGTCPRPSGCGVGRKTPRHVVPLR